MLQNTALPLEGPHGVVRCTAEIWDAHTNATNQKLQVAQKKYAEPAFRSVSNIKPAPQPPAIQMDLMVTC